MVSEDTPPLLFIFLFVSSLSGWLEPPPELLVVKPAQVCGSEGGQTIGSAFSEDERRERASEPGSHLGWSE